MSLRLKAVLIGSVCLLVAGGGNAPLAEKVGPEIQEAGLALADAHAAPAVETHTCPRTYLHTIYRGKHKCLSVALRKRIYYELVRYQDTHPGQDERAYYVIARRFRIPVGTARKIAIEGSLKVWPLPLPP